MYLWITARYDHTNILHLIYRAKEIFRLTSQVKTWDYTLVQQVFEGLTLKLLRVVGVRQFRVVTGSFPSPTLVVNKPPPHPPSRRPVSRRKLEEGSPRRRYQRNLRLLGGASRAAKSTVELRFASEYLPKSKSLTISIYCYAGMDAVVCNKTHYRSKSGC